MPTLLVDIGNSDIKFAVAGPNRILSSVTRVELKNVDSLDLQKLPPFYRAFIASVVPRAALELKIKLEKQDAEVRLLSARNVPMESRYKDMDTVGVDRLLAAFGGYKLHANGRPQIVFDFGTA